MINSEFDIIGFASQDEVKRMGRIEQLLKKSPIPSNELISYLNLYTRRQALSRVLFLDDLYKHFLDTHGIICEFGVRWGQDLAILASLRGIYEPYNYTRKIVGFDTFTGFPNVHELDGKDSIIKEGAYSVSDNYEEHLEQVLQYHESESPVSHIKKYELVKGDAIQTLPKYLEENPETIISFAYFDFDIYQPTKVCLEAIIPHLTKGSVIGFDELTLHAFPGETIALKEILGLNKISVQRSKYATMSSFIIWE